MLLKYKSSDLQSIKVNLQLCFQDLFRLQACKHLQFCLTDAPYDLSNMDIHTVTGALKLFFRELREPLFPFEHYEPLLNAFSKHLSNFFQLFLWSLLKDVTILKYLLREHGHLFIHSS